MSLDSQTTFKNPTILAVDDDPANLSILYEYLKEFGYRVIVARDGESALEKARYGRPDLILLDLLMPGMDGFETSHRLKADKDLRDIPVIFMTALTEVKDKVKGFQAGGVDYITKPFQFEEVLARIKTHLALDTERKRADEERTRLERALRQSQKMEAIGTLAGGIAHDFNNILMAIIGYTEIALLDLPEGSPVRRALGQVLKAGERAKELVGQILSFSRRSEQERKPVAVTLIVQEALKLLRSSLPTSIEIRQDLTLPSGGDVILGDPSQIHQVLMNLGTNAAHAMRTQGGLLSLSLSAVTADTCLISSHPDLQPGNYIRLTVSDNGHGMDESIMERIFDPYFTTKGVGEGTGLGLAVVQGIVKSHGGTITVYSEPGQGTCFQVFLPRIEHEAVSETEVEGELPGGRESLLFVDDEQALAELGKKWLESLGYQVTAKTDSIEALETFRLRPEAFDLLITDMTMPGLTGRQLAKEFLALRPGLPIILCTGFSHLINEKEAKEMGIREFVMKPYSITVLTSTIRKVLEENG